MSFENKDNRIKNLGLIKDNNFSIENYRKNLQAIRKKEEIIKSRIFNIDNLPKFPDINENKLKCMAHKFIDELDDLDINFIGVSIEVDFNQPMFVLHMPKEYRGGSFYAYDIPKEFMKYKVLPITFGKILF